jgi:hypothetical protein
MEREIETDLQDKNVSEVQVDTSEADCDRRTEIDEKNTPKFRPVVDITMDPVAGRALEWRSCAVRLKEIFGMVKIEDFRFRAALEVRLELIWALSSYDRMLLDVCVKTMSPLPLTVKLNTVMWYPAKISAGTNTTGSLEPR